MLGEKRGTSRLLAAGTVHLFQTFLLWVETRLLLCAPRPVGVHQQVKKKRGPLLVLFPPPPPLFFSVFSSRVGKKEKDRHYGASSPVHSETWDLWWAERSTAKSMGSPVRRARCRKVKGGMESRECAKGTQLIRARGDVTACGGGRF